MRTTLRLLDESPSSRRAWIEICARREPQLVERVALLAEGVDRNTLVDSSVALDLESPSSRRAWIEIDESRSSGWSIDRRPPRGGRG